MSREYAEVLGLRFFCGDIAAAVKSAETRILHGGVVFTPNAEMLYRAMHNPDFYRLLSSADMLLPDGQGVVIAGILAGKKLERLPGIEFGEALLLSGKRVYFLGGRPGVAARAAERMAARFPDALVVGTHHGYFSAAEEEGIVGEIAALMPDAVFVALGSPRQEEFIMRYRHSLPSSLLVGLGGSLDVYAGDKQRAPEIFRRTGCEWLYRVLKEPRRLRRVLCIPLFLAESFFYAEYCRFRHGIPHRKPRHAKEIAK